MVRKMFCAMFVMGVSFTLVAAADISGVITKVDGNKITFQEMSKAKKDTKSEKVGDPKVYTIGDSVAIVGSKFDKDTKKAIDGDAIKDGLKNEMFAKIDEKGIGATITVDGDKVSKIVVKGGKKKKAAE